MDCELTLDDIQSCTSDCPKSPSTTSWDGIFEASDLLRDKTAVSEHKATTVKKAFCRNQEQGDPSRAYPSSCFSASLGPVSELLYPSHFKILAAKIALNSGKPHLSSRGKVRLARQVRKPCPVNCKRCNNPRLTDLERATIFKRFWSLCNHELQWKFISDSVQVTPPKRRCARQGAKREKKAIRHYYFTVNDTTKKICKTMFKNTLCICDSWIDNALSHFQDGDYVPDQRGKVKQRPLLNSN
ncbi:Putative 4-diphosphocytidyl-2-C-methyl-D-erythritol kinase [Frankliniella fusca]|uniref:4-diphosphocytidyl-2-C-methyl-D-erythritol kinase n=1 Tax=Frankliniella fusca TaxID=407009 RepID=A0AAE1HC72_9NEOP|nr:Putative 4-diphosphocytidyl-2-C-methyl-D-erythritol kinase [Frankliniella fusca]